MASPHAAAVALHPRPGGGRSPFAACVRLTPELRAALLQHAAAPGAAAASVTFSAAGAGAVRASPRGRCHSRQTDARRRMRLAARLRRREGLPVRVVRRGGGHLQPLCRPARRGRATPGGGRAAVRPAGASRASTAAAADARPPPPRAAKCRCSAAWMRARAIASRDAARTPRLLARRVCATAAQLLCFRCVVC